MSKISKVVLPDDQSWVDINTSSGIAVGTAMTIQNTSTIWVHLAESDSEPTEAEYHKVITSLTYNNAEAQVLTGSGRVWARSSVATRQGTLAIQEVS